MAGYAIMRRFKNYILFGFFDLRETIGKIKVCDKLKILGNIRNSVWVADIFFGGEI
jgi:hypothetical protein